MCIAWDISNEPTHDTIHVFSANGITFNNVLTKVSGGYEALQHNPMFKELRTGPRCVWQRRLHARVARRQKEHPADGGVFWSGNAPRFHISDDFDRLNALFVWSYGEETTSNVEGPESVHTESGALPREHALQSLDPDGSGHLRTRQARKQLEMDWIQPETTLQPTVDRILGSDDYAYTNLLVGTCP